MGGDPRIDNGQPKTAAAASSDQAKAAIQLGNDNARITQDVMKNRRLPNGDPLPSPGHPGDVQPRGFHPAGS